MSEKKEPILIYNPTPFMKAFRKQHRKLWFFLLMVGEEAHEFAKEFPDEPLNIVPFNVKRFEARVDEDIGAFYAMRKLVDHGLLEEYQKSKKIFMREDRIPVHMKPESRGLKFYGQDIDIVKLIKIVPGLSWEVRHG